MLDPSLIIEQALFVMCYLTRFQVMYGLFVFFQIWNSEKLLENNFVYILRPLVTAITTSKLISLLLNLVLRICILFNSLIIQPFDFSMKRDTIIFLNWYIRFFTILI